MPLVKDGGTHFGGVCEVMGVGEREEELRLPAFDDGRAVSEERFEAFWICILFLNAFKRFRV